MSPRPQPRSARPNPLDRFLTLADQCEHPEILQDFCARHWGLALVRPDSLPDLRRAAQALGHRLIPQIDQPHDGQLLTTPAVVRHDLDTLLTELARRVKRLSTQQLRALRGRIIDGVSILTHNELPRRATAPHNQTRGGGP